MKKCRKVAVFDILYYVISQVNFKYTDLKFCTNVHSFPFNIFPGFEHLDFSEKVFKKIK